MRKRQVLTGILAFVLVCGGVSARAAVKYGDTAYDDLTYSNQWYLTDDGGMDFGAAWGWEDDKIPDGLRGEGVTVAVIDTGIYMEHKCFANTNILPGKNVSGDGAAEDDVRDGNYHGTMVTGVIAGNYTKGENDSLYNRDKYTGAAYDVNILPIKTFFAKQNGSTLNSIADGIDYAISQGVDIINLSCGSTYDSSKEKEAIQKAVDAGIIVVAGAGNDGNSTLMYPAAYENVIGVGSINKTGKVSSFSQRNTSVWVTVPGEDICTPRPIGEVITYYNTESGGKATAYFWPFGTDNGTSFSSALVSSLAAIAKQYANAHEQSLTPAEFKNLLRLTACDQGEEGYDTSYGWGTVHVGDVLEGMVEREVAFDLNGGEWEGEAPEITYIPYSDNVIELPQTGMSKEGYVFNGWYADPDFQGGPVTSFVPSEEYTERAFYARWSPVFTDVPAGAWYKNAVSWAADNGVMEGKATWIFAPDSHCTRAEVITYLWRLAGSPVVIEENTFTDVPENAWYQMPLAWAVQNGIINGTSSDTLDPDGPCTRAEIVTFLWRAAGNPSVEENSWFADTPEGSWYQAPMSWAVQNGVTTGTSADTFSPEKLCTRAEIAAFLWKQQIGLGKVDEKYLGPVQEVEHQFPLTEDGVFAWEENTLVGSLTIDGMGTWDLWYGNTQETLDEGKVLLYKGYSDPDHFLILSHNYEGLFGPLRENTEEGRLITATVDGQIFRFQMTRWEYVTNEVADSKDWLNNIYYGDDSIVLVTCDTKDGVRGRWVVYGKWVP